MATPRKENPQPGGRPSTYREAYCNEVIELGKLGKSKAQIAAVIGTTRDTMADWAKVHPEFDRAVKLAHEGALAWWEDAGQEGLHAAKFNAVAFIFQVKNRFREEYRNDTSDFGVKATVPLGDASDRKLVIEIVRPGSSDTMTTTYSGDGEK